VSVASGAVVYAFGQGTIVFNAGEMGYICLDDVLHIPQLDKSLISVSRLIDREVQVKFNKDGVHLQKNDVKLFAPRDGNMFIMKPNIVILDSESACLITEKCPKEGLELWHQRLGHFHLNGIRSLAENNLVEGLPSFDFSKRPVMFCQG
jgi:hypothetical protein